MDHDEGRTLMRGPFSAGVMLAALCALAGCGPVLENPSPPAVVAQDMQVQAGNLYRLDVGDQIEIHHLIDTDYTVVTTVRPDGRIAVPGIHEPIQAAGGSIEELAERLGPLYQSESQIRTPSFTILLRNSPSQQVFIGGEVARPGFLVLDGGPRRLMQVLAAAGWILPTARSAEIIIVRQATDGHPLIFAANLRHVISGQDLSQNYLIQAKDTIMVPKSDIASLDSWIDRYIHQPVPGWASAAATYQFNGTGTGTTLVH